MITLGKVCDICFINNITKGKRCRECGPFYAAAERAYNRCKKKGKLRRWNRLMNIRDMTLHLKYWYEKHEGKCYYTGEKMGLGELPRGMNISVERIHVNGRYDTKNTVLCLSLINRMKTDLENDDVFYEICMHIVGKHLQKQIDSQRVSYADAIYQLMQLFPTLTRR